MTRDLVSKVIVLTGATEGIGKAAARELAGRGATLVLVSRSREKTDRVAAELAKESGNDAIEAVAGDLSSLAELRAVARTISAKHSRLDVLINNAGAIFDDRRFSADGVELTFALNHLAYFALTIELLELLTNTEGARVVSTSSGAHSMGSTDFTDFVRRERGYSPLKAYGDAKLANILFTQELTRRTRGRVIANCFHPGFVRTRFGAENRFFINRLIQLAAPLFARPPEKGAETLVWLAASADAAGYAGEYFQDKKVVRTKPAARDEEAARRLWTLCEELCAPSAETSQPATLSP